MVEITDANIQGMKKILGLQRKTFDIMADLNRKFDQIGTEDLEALIRFSNIKLKQRMDERHAK